MRMTSEAGAPRRGGVVQCRDIRNETSKRTGSGGVDRMELGHSQNVSGSIGLRSGVIGHWPTL
jgi:hypothetical protein